MQFIDQATIEVRGGRGGDGISAFRREKYVPKGGPSGGDGGKGGDVLLVADANIQTLLDFKFQRIFLAGNGNRGGPNRRSGASGTSLRVKMPCGTEVRDSRTNILIGDLTNHGDELLVAYGGKGGLGNAHYLSNKNRAPEKFTEGKEGEWWKLQLELKLLAEVGIIGLPNSGKSTLISVLSAAKPKIADYPFTTLIPNLGMVRRPSGDGTLFADIPGLIQGAARGAGLGHDFLRHIERTLLLIHLLDASSPDINKNMKIVEKELDEYGHGLKLKPMLVVLNKADVVEPQKLELIVREMAQILGYRPLAISAVANTGLICLKNEIWKTLELGQKHFNYH